MASDNTVQQVVRSVGTLGTPYRKVTEGVTTNPASEATKTKPATDVRQTTAENVGNQSSKEALAAQEKANAEALEKTVNQFKERIQSVHRDLEFSIDDASKRTVIKVVDSETGETVRQIPAEDFLELARRMDDVEGLLFRDEV